MWMAKPEYDESGPSIFQISKHDSSHRKNIDIVYVARIATYNKLDVLSLLPVKNDKYKLIFVRMQHVARYRDSVSSSS